MVDRFHHTLRKALAVEKPFPFDRHVIAAGSSRFAGYANSFPSPRKVNAKKTLRLIPYEHQTLVKEEMNSEVHDGSCGTWHHPEHTAGIGKRNGRKHENIL
jgi:hypothetical protein